MCLSTWPVAAAVACVLSASTAATTDQASRPQLSLPEDIKSKVLEKLGFQVPIEKNFNRLFSSPGSRSVFAAMVEGDDHAALWQTRLLLPRGYLVKRATKTERGALDWNEYGELLSGGVQDLLPTQKLRPYLSARSDGTATIRVGRRALDSVDYSNRWQMNGLETWSFTFSYHIEPILPDLPTLGAYKGKGSAQINPATGEFDAVTSADVGERFGSALADHGADEYLDWLRGASAAAPAAGVSADLERATPTPVPAAIEERVDCADFEKCLRDGVAARDGNDWRRAAAFFERARGFSDTDPRGWLELGQAHVATQDYAKGSAAWDQVIALGGALEFGSCLSGITCKAGRLRLSKEVVSFVSDKGETVFSAAPSGFIAKGPKRARVMFTSSSAVWLDLEANGKKWKVSFLPPGVRGCDKSSSYLCPDPGPDTQEAVAAYVKGRLEMLGRGEVPSVATHEPGTR